MKLTVVAVFMVIQVIVIILAAPPDMQMHLPTDSANMVDHPDGRTSLLFLLMALFTGAFLGVRATHQEGQVFVPTSHVITREQWNPEGEQSRGHWNPQEAHPTSHLSTRGQWLPQDLPPPALHLLTRGQWDPQYSLPTSHLPTRGQWESQESLPPLHVLTRGHWGHKNEPFVNHVFSRMQWSHPQSFPESYNQLRREYDQEDYDE